jgi:ubiquinone/menaquinone biosynthesis C-methylase UbiE
MSRVMSAIYDRFMSSSERACLESWRAELLSDLDGDVLEIGAGTGANVALYPPSVTRLVLSEPDAHMRAKLEAKLGGARVTNVEVSAASADALPFADGTFDAVVCTLVLCSVADPPAALAEMRRVLRPGGRLVFIEHVAADERSGRYRWQRWVEPVWKRLMGNCHVTRRTEESIRAAGFELREVRRESLRKAIPIARPSVRGVAVR